MDYLSMKVTVEDNGRLSINNDEKRKEMVSLFDSEKKKVYDVRRQIDKSRGSQATTRYVIMMNACEIIIIIF